MKGIRIVLKIALYTMPLQLAEAYQEAQDARGAELT